MKNKAKILIVDDNPNNLFALETTFKDVDAEFIKATSGNNALKEILRQGDDFALAILDVRMPEMDGYELAQLIHFLFFAAFPLCDTLSVSAEEEEAGKTFKIIHLLVST